MAWACYSHILPCSAVGIQPVDILRIDIYVAHQEVPLDANAKTPFSTTVGRAAKVDLIFTMYAYTYIRFCMYRNVISCIT